MTYQYKVPRRTKRPRKPGERLKEAPPELSGVVMGKPASDLEERFAYALGKARLPFEFARLIEHAMFLPHEDRQIDFIVWDGNPYPIEIDGEYAHKTAGQKEQDMMRDAMLDDILGGQGYMPIQRIEGWRVETQDRADATVEELF